ncbi:hypothetical protein [Paludisphaera borealis]|uniref:YkgJ family cysteine cluster protein n=1 Tax=Paludisphaera borealis TaxID=1387353 RepID=A0A1U7CL96_9BACT|nr:hypothetical protein [Paludisphaera borealis]APW59699.1 hypothetical protein BSF38_01130 [Paludisphaera borealis]
MTTEPLPQPTTSLADEARLPLRTLYGELDQAVADLAPVCQLSGRCCRFEEYGHTLFLSAAEAAVLIADAPPTARPFDPGATCPWQDRQGRCTAREARPLGCRVYFCDPRYDAQAPVLTERFLTRLKELTDQRGWPWNYAPLHRHLAPAYASGELFDPREPGEVVGLASPITGSSAPPGRQP